MCASIFITYTGAMDISTLINNLGHYLHMLSYSHRVYIDRARSADCRRDSGPLTVSSCQRGADQHVYTKREPRNAARMKV